MFQKADSYFDLKISKEPKYVPNENGNTVVALFSIKWSRKGETDTRGIRISEVFDLSNGKIQGIRDLYFTLSPSRNL
jgi:hypothetical protein